METTKSHAIFNLRQAYLFHSDVETKQLRSFGVIFFVFFAVILGLGPIVFSKAPPRGWAVGVGGAFLLVGLVAPRALRSLYQAWMVFGGIMGFINTRIILGLVFFVIITPVSFIRKLLGKDSLGLKYMKDAETYRIPMSNEKNFNMSRQF